MDEIAHDEGLTQEDRAGRIEDIFLKSRGYDDPDSKLTDILADLMHWADVYGEDFEAHLNTAIMHYEAEK